MFAVVRVLPSTDPSGTPTNVETQAGVDERSWATPVLSMLAHWDDGSGKDQEVK